MDGWTSFTSPSAHLQRGWPLLLIGVLTLFLAPPLQAQPRLTSPASIRATVLYADAPFVRSSARLRTLSETPSLMRAFKDQERDPWLGFDKVQHATFSFLWTLSSQYTFVNKFALSEGRALPLSLGSGAALGLGKEAYDRRYGSGLFSYRDLVADAVGLALAAAVILL